MRDAVASSASAAEPAPRLRLGVRRGLLRGVREPPAVPRRHRHRVTRHDPCRAVSSCARGLAQPRARTRHHPPGRAWRRPTGTPARGGATETHRAGHPWRCPERRRHWTCLRFDQRSTEIGFDDGAAGVRANSTAGRLPACLCRGHPAVAGIAGAHRRSPRLRAFWGRNRARRARPSALAGAARHRKHTASSPHCVSSTERLPHLARSSWILSESLR